MTQNLYDFLRQVLKQGKDFRPSPSDLVWVKGFLENNDIELVFKATKVDETTTGIPVMRTDFSFRGEPVELFELMVEGGFASEVILETIRVSAAFFRDHVPFCEDCKTNHDAKCGNYRLEIIQLNHGKSSEQGQAD